MTGMSNRAQKRRRQVRARARAVGVVVSTMLVAALATVLSGSPATAAESLPGGSYLFAVLENNSLVAIDRTTDLVVRTMSLPAVTSSAVADIQTSPDQSTVYVVTGSSITAVDTRSMTVSDSYLDTAGSGFVSMAVSPDGSRLYAYAYAGWVDVLELPSLTRLGQVTVRIPALSIARTVTADDSFGYVSTGPHIAVLPNDGGPVVATYLAGVDLASVVAVEDSLYVVDLSGNLGEGEIVGLDSSTGSPNAGIDPEFQLGETPLTASPDGRYLYLGEPNRPRLGRFDLNTSSAEPPVTLAGQAGAAVVAADTGVVYVPLVDNHTQMAKIATWPTASTITVPHAAWAVTLVDLPSVAPGAPTVTTLTNGDSQVSVGFTPGTPGSSPTTGYRVTATDVTNPARGGQTATGTASPVTVPGLTNGDAYTFTVTALSADGNSPPSAPSNALTVGVPPIVAGTAPTAIAGSPYKFQFTVTGKPAPVVGIDPTTRLPAGLTFDSTTATLSGTPTEAGTTFFNVLATSTLGQATFRVQFVVSEADPGTGTPTPTPTASTSPTPTPSATTTAAHQLEQPLQRDVRPAGQHRPARPDLPRRGRRPAPAGRPARRHDAHTPPVVTRTAGRTVCQQRPGMRGAHADGGPRGQRSSSPC